MFWSVTLSLLEGLREVVKLFALTLVFSLPLASSPPKILRFSND